MGDILNPYEAGRNIHGRYGRVFRSGTWIANATEVSYTVEIDRMEVRRAGTRWVDMKEGELSGSGSLTVDHVASNYLREFVNYVNGLDVDGNTLAGKTLPGYTLLVTLEDDQIPGLVKDVNGEAISGHEAVELRRVKFWNLEGGYGSEMISRSLEFTFAGIAAPSLIDDGLDFSL